MNSLKSKYLILADDKERLEIFVQSLSKIQKAILLRSLRAARLKVPACLNQIQGGAQ